MKRIFLFTLLATLLMGSVTIMAQDKGFKIPGQKKQSTTKTAPAKPKSNHKPKQEAKTKSQSKQVPKATSPRPQGNVNMPGAANRQGQGANRSASQGQGAAKPSLPAPADQTFTVNGVSFTMIGVGGGTFSMGATAEQGSDAWDVEEPAHRVTVSSFHIGKYEVTQALWQAVMGSNPSWFKGDNLPVEEVSWDDCQEFIRKLNRLTGKRFRLPTEAEWEYAARGGSKSRGYKYSGSNTISAVAWYDGNSGSKTHPVGTKAPNELGLYDMSGNVWEWCQDWDGSYSSNAQTNPTGPSSGSGRVIRGGGWSSYARDCRVSFRSWNYANNRNDILGLRLAF